MFYIHVHSYGSKSSDEGQLYVPEHIGVNQKQLKTHNWRNILSSVKVQTRAANQTKEQRVT